MHVENRDDIVTTTLRRWNKQMSFGSNGVRGFGFNNIVALKSATTTMHVLTTLVHGMCISIMSSTVHHR